MPNEKKSSRIRIPKHFTLSPEAHELLQKYGTNASKLVDRLILDSVEQIKPAFVLVSENRWTERELNPRPLPCQGSDLPLIYQPVTSHS
jgi:hypothetical protein